MHWLYLHFTQLQLDGLYQHQEQSGTTPCIIVDPKQHSICQLNPAAKDKGLTVGMGLATAATLCHPLTILGLNPEFEQQRLLELAHAFYSLTANITLFEPQGLLFEVSSMLAFYDGIESYLGTVKRELSRQKVHATLTLGDTPRAAKLLSRTGYSHLNIEPAERTKILDQIPIERLEIADKQIAQLKRIGLHNLIDIETLPRKDLGLRFGIALLNYIDEVRGNRPTPLNYFEPKDFFSRSMALEHEINHTTALLFPIKSLLGHLQTYLQARVLLVHTINITLGFRDKSTQIIDLASAEPERQRQAWLTLVQLKLESLRLSAPVVDLRLEAFELLSPKAQSEDLFDEQKSISPKQLISRLQAKLGKPYVKQIQLHEDHRPEHAFSYQPVGCDAVTESKTAQKPILAQPKTLRPSLLLDPPRALTEHIRIIHGPERIQTAWWTSSAICRDYFVARNQHQQTLWVFRDQEQQWFVHGLFA